MTEEQAERQPRERNPRLRLVVAAAPPEPALDPSQRRAVDALSAPGGPIVVTGAAGTGKTSVVVAAAARAVSDGTPPDRVLVIAPTRQTAAALRDRVATAIGAPTGSPVVRTAASVAFAVLRAEADALEEPRPALVSGAEQDVVLHELLDGHHSGRVAPLDWGDAVPQEATILPGFREELRNLLMRAAERGVEPDRLAELGRATGRREWEAAAALYEEYESVMALRSTPLDQGGRYDPATILSRATEALAWWDSTVGSAARRPSWDVVIVDDAQDATAAVHDLLARLADDGARVVLVGNADESVQGYRGAVPERLAEPLAIEGGVHVELTHDHRQSALAAVSARVAERIGVKGSASARGAYRDVQVAPPEREGSERAAPVRSITAPHRYAQSRAIAAALRRARHGLDGAATEWKDMAVIARSGAQLRALRSDLLAADIPCEPLGDGTALHRESAVAPLLTLLKVAFGEPWDEDSAVEVLTSRLVGLDAVGLRRLRRALVRDERQGGGARTSAELLNDALGDPARCAALPGPEPRAAARAARAVVAARERAHAPAPTPGAVVWAAWEALDVAESWRAAALAGSTRDDADLDAVIALMRAAQSFTERLPEAPAVAFLDYLEAQDFAADSLGLRGRAPDAVSFCTPASAAGREWDVVVVAGLEEGVWPNLRLRDSVLGAQAFADLVTAGGLSASPDAALAAARGPRDLRGARASVLDDETRALLVAVSRARARLIVTAVDDGEARPSRFLTLIEDAAGITREDAAQTRVVSDLRSAVARLRASGVAAAARLEREPSDVRARGELEGAAAQLADLAARGIAGADPARWHGVPDPSTDAPFWDEDVPVRVSPSRLDAVRTCALRWALESSGGTPESSDAQQVGLLVHEIAAQYPDGGEEQMLAELELRWADVGGQETWIEREDYARAQAMVRRLAAYLGGVSAERALVEEGFSVTLGRAQVAGIADRVEVSGSEARIVDLKTGAKISRAEASDHGQLMLYQLVAAHGAFAGVERATDAALVFVGKDAARAGSVVEQAAIDPEAAREVLDAAVETMTAPIFTATTNPLCERCPVRRACPAHASGRQVSDS